MSWQMSKDAIKLLRNIEWKQGARPNGTCPYCAYTKEHGHSATCRFGQAISLLESQPEPTEFTAMCRSDSSCDSIHHCDCSPLLLEACDLIDRLTAENKELKEIIDSKPTPDANGFWGKITGRLYRKSKSQQAEIERLKDALIHIEEYWNRDQNETAMYDALWHIIETCNQALQGERP